MEYGAGDILRRSGGDLFLVLPLGRMVYIGNEEPTRTLLNKVLPLPGPLELDVECVGGLSQNPWHAVSEEWPASNYRDKRTPADFALVLLQCSECLRVNSHRLYCTRRGVVGRLSGNRPDTHATSETVEPAIEPRTSEEAP